MIDKIIHKLNVNPFLNGLIFQAFYNGYGNNECQLHLSYLVLPLILNGKSRRALMSINKNQNIIEFTTRNKLNLINLQEDIWKLRSLTNESLIILHNNNQIELKDLVRIKEVVDYKNYNLDLMEYLKSATNLGILLRQESIQNIYKTLNVIP